MEHTMNWDMLEQFRSQLADEEKSDATIQKYIHEVRAFFEYVQDRSQIDKETVITYKKHLLEIYAVTSVNSILAALNRFFKFMNWYDCTVKALKVQKEAFRSREKELTKEEYYRLLQAAKSRGNRRLYLLMQTICSTGIRISELPFITVEAVSTGRARVSLKGKTRTVLLPSGLCRELKKYIRACGIQKGSVFITRNGRPMDRSNVLHEMKALCPYAKVDRRKVFPHNLRHLFACTYYQMKKDLPHLADLLGHSNINTTRIYTLVSGEEQIRQIEKLGLVVPERK